MQTAIDLASIGDTVKVPAGECSWDTCITVDKSIVLMGSGIDTTILHVYNFLLDNVDNVRITNFTFDGDGINGNKKSTQPIDSKNFRIDHCKYINYDGHQIKVSGYSSGVIDHCQFVDITAEGIMVIADPAAARINPSLEPHFSRL